MRAQQGTQAGSGARIRAAVIRTSKPIDTCDHSSEDKQAELSEMMRMPLEDVLVKVRVQFQEKLVSAQITALLRVVITEIKRFPDLAETVYRAFFVSWEVNLDAFLAKQELLKGVDAKTRRKLCEAFFSHLVGTDVLRTLLGLKGASANARVERARAAADALLAKL